MAAQQRRLIRDHAALRDFPPPDYFFASDQLDELTALTIYLVGPSTTPYEGSVFRLTLRIPPNYPQEPPKANFETKIFHPNVDERTGDVCVETLKRDWDPKLTLRDILLTIRCLLIVPNPTSALNEASGKLLLDDYDEFARHARIMSEVHAPVPDHLKRLVEETNNRRAPDEDPNDQSSKTLATNAGTNAAPKPAVSSSPRKRRGPSRNSKPVQTHTVIRKVRRAVSPTTRATSAEDSDSGKENHVVAPRLQSPTGGKRSREESPAIEENEKGGATKEATESPGRKSPKLKEDSSTGNPGIVAQKKRVIASKGRQGQKKPGPRIGLKRF